MKNLSNSVQYNLEQDLSKQQQSFARKNIHARKIWTDASEVVDIDWVETTEIEIPDNQIYIDLGTIPTTVRIINLRLSTANGFAADFAVKFFIPDNTGLKVVRCFVDNELTNTKNMPTGNAPYKSHNYYLIRVIDTFAEYQNYFSSEGISTIIPDIDGKHQEHIGATINFTAKDASGAMLLTDIEQETLPITPEFNGQSRVGSGHATESIEMQPEFSANGKVGSAHAQESYGFNIDFSSSSVWIPHALPEESGSATMELMEFTITPPPEDEGSGS